MHAYCPKKTPTTVMPLPIIAITFLKRGEAQGSPPAITCLGAYAWQETFSCFLLRLYVRCEVLYCPVTDFQLFARVKQFFSAPIDG